MMEDNSTLPQDSRLQPDFPAISSEISYLLELSWLCEFNPKNAKTFAYVSCVLLLFICVWVTHRLAIGGRVTRLTFRGGGSLLASHRNRS